MLAMAPLLTSTMNLLPKESADNVAGLLIIVEPSPEPLSVRSLSTTICSKYSPGSILLHLQRQLTLLLVELFENPFPFQPQVSWDHEQALLEQ